MFGSIPQPAHRPCPKCGVSLTREEWDAHACDEAQKLRYELVQLREEAGRFDAELARWLKTAAGRFEVFYAARRRGQTSGA
jgi:hypothetical protein